MQRHSRWPPSRKLCSQTLAELLVPAIMPATFSKLFEVEGCGDMSIHVFIVVVHKFSSFSESVLLKAESVILKAVDCVHLNCKDFSD